MKAQWQTVMKPAFLNDIRKLQPRELHHVMEKINVLSQDPQPDGKQKRHLVHCSGKKFCRIRTGDFRIFYTYNHPIVTIYRLDRRRDNTYYQDYPEPDHDFETDDDIELDQLDLTEEVYVNTAVSQPDWEQIFTRSQVRPLPEPITIEMLKRLDVPEVCYPRLLKVQNEDELLSCPGIDDTILLRIHEYLFEQPLVQIMQQPDLVLNDTEDLMRYREGDLLGFLLKLSPEQERYASWSLKVNGPTLVKGGPGTGKSTVALYRIRSLLQQLLKSESGTPRILFTTYTHALVKSSEQLLNQLLGKDAHYVTVTTADSMAHKILDECSQANTLALLNNDDNRLRMWTRQAVEQTTFTGHALQQRIQNQCIQHMGIDYLIEEINTVIVARQIDTLEQYKETGRTGRKLALNALQRTAVWQVYERWRTLIREQGYETWQQRRDRTARLAQKSMYAQYYDGVIIDEAQDLDPSMLRMLVAICKSPNRLFITADANQSIYSSGFTWTNVHETLKFQGRTSILRANYRSTREIGEAAQSYLANGELEPETSERQYINSGPIPDARRVLNTQHEVQLLVNYFLKASRSLNFAIGSCAVLCPSEDAGRVLEAALREHGLDATYMSGRDLNLTRPGIKIMKLKSSKGLEFPVVALAGFGLSNYPVISDQATGEEREELLARERRTLFVGMTRAMRALLVIIPNDSKSSLLQGFDRNYWNFDRNM
jgi:superfamily I DNA/RNA helicase/mRNA-degrading endonuclease RelE of RelBE toxin-antitoxin system